MGLVDFAKGIGEGVVDIAENVGGAAVNLGKATAYAADPRNLDNIASGIGNAAEFVAKNPGQVWDVGFEVGRAVVKDQLKPQNLLINAALLATGVGAPALIAKAGLSARGVGAAVEGLNVADKVSDMTRTQRVVQKAAQGLEKADDLLRAPQRLQNKALEHIPGGGRVKAFSEWRGAKAEGVMGWAGESRAKQALARPISRSVAGGDTFAGAAQGGTNLSRASWRLDKAQSLDPRNLSENAQVAGEVTKAIANPEQAARHLAKAGWEEYGDEAMRYGAQYGAKKVLTGGDSKKPKPETHDYAPAPTGSLITGSDWERSESYGYGTRNVRQSARDIGAVGTVSDDTMPRAIGPSNWYGPQGGYRSGRGFSGGNIEGDLMAKYVSGRGFATGANSTVYGGSNNTQGNTFLFLGGATGGDGGGGGGGRNKVSKGDRKRRSVEGQYGFKRFWRGRSELEGIGMDFDWRNTKRPEIREGYGALKAVGGVKRAKQVGRGTAAVARGTTGVVRGVAGNAAPPQPGVARVDATAPMAMEPVHVEGAKPAGTQFNGSEFYEQNKNFLGGAFAQMATGAPTTGISMYPHQSRGEGEPIPLGEEQKVGHWTTRGGTIS